MDNIDRPYATKEIMCTVHINIYTPRRRLLCILDIHPSRLLSSLLSLSLGLTVVVTLSIAVLMAMSVTVRVAATGLPVVAAAAEATASAALHSLGVASRSSAAGSSVSLRRSLESPELSITLLAERFELAALLVEQADVVVAVAVGFVAGGDGVVAELAGVVEGLGEGFDFDLVFGGFLWVVLVGVDGCVWEGKGRRAR
jgi:hypothetical protein